VLLATFDTAVGAGLEDVARPAETDFAGAPGLDACVAVELGGGDALWLFGAVGVADVLCEPGCAGDCVPVVDAGPVVWVLGVAVGGDAAVLGPVAGGGVIDEFDGGVEVFVSVAVVGGVGSLAAPSFSDGAAPTCGEWSIGVGPATWCASSCKASASSGCRLAGGAWFGDGSAWVGDP